MSIDFRCFHLILDKYKCKCSICQKYVAPITYGFNNCCYGSRLNAQKFVSEKWVEVSN